MAESKETFLSRFSVKKGWKELTDKQFRPLYKRILLLTGPAFVELLLTSLFGMVDMVMVGNLDATTSGDISSVGITNQPFFLLISFFAAVNVGTTTLVAWRVGSGKSKEASGILSQSLLINTVLSIILGAVGILFAAPVMNFMSSDARVATQAAEYFQIICAGLPFMAINLAVTAALRGAGQTKIPMFYNLIANAANVFMNYVLIFGHFGFPRMGVAGAALATTISRVMSCVMALLYVFLSKNSAVRLGFKNYWKPKLETVKLLFSIGLPSSLEQLALQSGLLLFQYIVARLGNDTYDAHQIAISVNSLAFSVSNAFSVSTTTMVGQAVGADDYGLAEQYVRFTRRIARIITFTMAIFLVIFARQICGIYTKVPAVIDLAMPAFFIMALVQFVQSSQMCTAGALRGAGDTMYPFYSSLFGIWVLRLPLALLLCYLLEPYGLGLLGAWGSFFADQCLRNVIIKRRFTKGKWKTIKAKKESKRLAMAD